MPLGYHIILILLFFIFQNPIEGIIPAFTYFDEVITMLYCTIAIISQLLKGGKAKKSTVLILFLTALILVFGIIGNFLYEYQIKKYGLVDAFKVIQFILIFLSVRALEPNGSSIVLSKVIQTIIKIISIIFLILVILNYSIEYFPTYDERFGLRAQMLFYIHPTYLVSACILMISILTISLRDSKKNMKYIHVLNLVMLTTLRTKAILFIILYYTILFFISKRIKFRWYHYIFISSLVLYIGISMMYDSIVYNPNYPRTIMFSNSIEISLEHFPFGAGFGTYGSYVSGEHYSKLYYLYGNIYRYYGLSPENFSAISDTYWPMLLAQSGIIGTFLLIIILVLIFKLVINVKNYDRYIFISILLLCLYLIISSTAESSFSNPYATAYFYFIALLINYKK
ncbi:hypothetical protein P5G62_023290 [Neobacillus sp. 179-C4.2 HS]|uniref:Uncharacterized protein n=1 Tax=Neobacillus driksii TaxID=3035913 RepID=A0ABV4Z1T7_9BACI|nr:hypothetical protein [Neobacillus sp. 179.-C4.2 HS]MDP5194620.1 hypothetical protein [Neobacillus sp. 179.-C4.2 HS]